MAKNPNTTQESMKLMTTAFIDMIFCCIEVTPYRFMVTNSFSACLQDRSYLLMSSSGFEL